MSAIISFLQYFSSSLINFIFANIFLIRSFFIAISVVFLFLIVYLNIRVNATREKIEHWTDVIGAASIPERRSLKAWKQIEKRMKIGNQTQLKLSILEADRILDEMLKLGGFLGRNTDERLENMTSSDLSNIEDIRRVRAMRNKILSDLSLTLTVEETQGALDICKRAFREFGLMK